MAQREKIRARDKGDLDRLVEEGDLIEFERGAYSHWAVYVGNDEVVHVTGEDDELPVRPEHVFKISGQQYGKVIVMKSNIWKVALDNPFYVNNTADARITARDKQDIKIRALSKLGEKRYYNILTKNCEHFATSCRYGEEFSDQVRKFRDGVLYPIDMTNRFRIWLFGRGQANPQ